MIIATWIRRELVSSTSDLARTGQRRRPPAPDAGPCRTPSRRARGGLNVWWSGPGSLTFTLAIDPLRMGSPPRTSRGWPWPRRSPWSTRSARPPLGVRWPNDVEAGGRKLGGILPERVETPRGPRLLIGVGLNVRTRLDDAPAAVRALAASLSEWGDPPEPDDVLSAFLDAFAMAVARLAADDPSLASRWAELDTLLGEPVRVDLGPRVVSGVGRGIDPKAP